MVAKDPTAAVRAANDRTAAAKTVYFDLDTKIGTGGAKLATGTGAFDFVVDRGRFELNSTLVPIQDMLITADRVYIKRPEPQPAQKPWIFYTDSQIAAGGSGVGFLTYIRSQIDPRQALRNLGSTVKDVKKVGGEKIRGVATTHLTGRVEPPDAAAYPLDLWLDHVGRVRRMQWDVGGATALLGGKTTIRFDLYDFGKDPKIVVPPDADAEPAPEQPAA